MIDWYRQSGISKFKRVNSAVRALAVSGLRVACRMRGVRLAEKPFISDAMDIALGRYEFAMSATIRRFLKAGDTALDIGGNLGIIARTMGDAVGKTGRVLTFEPNPVAFDLLRFNCKTRRQIQAFNVGLGREAATLKFYSTGNLATGTLVAGLLAHEDTERYGSVHAVEVRVEQGDAFLRQHNTPTPALIKIDVEGFEVAVLDGIAGTIGPSFKGVLLIEVFPASQVAAGQAPLAPVDWLFDHGFHVYELEESGAGRLIKVERSRLEELRRRIESRHYAMAVASREPLAA